MVACHQRRVVGSALRVMAAHRARHFPRAPRVVVPHRLRDDGVSKLRATSTVSADDAERRSPHSAPVIPRGRRASARGAPQSSEPLSR